MEPSTIWTGFEPAQGAAASPAELLSPSSDPGGGVLYELLALAGRGFRPPRYLTVTGTPHDAASAEGAPDLERGFRATWSVAYRVIAETAPHGVTTPYAIYLLGVDPPADATEVELEVFNDFYTNVHLVEVAERRHALRAERYERDHVIVPPVKGAPRFLAVYEFDEAGSTQRRHVGPPYSAGPEVWQRHTTPWRVWYRRMPT
jgi:hypothetical protein